MQLFKFILRRFFYSVLVIIGVLLLESFFGIPGLGYAGVNALMNSDLQMVKALVILTAILFVFINLIADITYAWADPRMR